MDEYMSLPAEVEQLADRLLARQRFGSILTVRDYPELNQLIRFVDYRGQTWWATRKKVDELDQVTFSRITR